jgi:predicted NUDIX family NTP pyrophosphohydrolase
VPKRSAGILLFQVRHGQLRVLLVHPGGPYWRGKDAGAWSIPKGEHDRDEPAKLAAFREFAEETGIAIPETDAIDLGEIRQRSGKPVAAWAVEGDFDPAALRSNLFEMPWPPKSGRTESFPEIDRAEWFDPDTARRKINTAQAEWIDRLTTALQRQGRLDEGRLDSGTTEP